MRAEILDFLRQNQGKYVSGEEISRELNVSRTAVWKHIRALKQDGYQIEAHTRAGYCLRGTTGRLLPEEIKAVLTTKVMGQEIYYYPQIGSTNNEAKKLAAGGCPEGTIVVAETQNTGRGRLARGWFSPYGKGIWMSVVLRPPFSPLEASKCTLMAAVAVNRVIRQVAGVYSGIKWPNDILFQGRKLVGILTEMSAEMDAINYVVIGMGINVNIEEREFPGEIAATATSLLAVSGREIDRRMFLAAILKELETAYHLVQTGGFTSILDDWRSQSITLGKNVDVIGPDHRYSGLAIDIDNEGALLVKTAQGVRKVLAGDVSIRPVV
ncbi:MAG TPA: biotin--[acetyl-CoA-carboxylase] ligase [Methylomusa anaerophila]|uniref:Bifunctional ligase/repressor BirA n=1 Tax=Methylomusa anaerophila TaxID=1930071 RepID=A0A348AJQ2_9FIRM|nr:biotin--[acetyl-CoA-carboxylase] ligase [Methylomusa anaerophila]BBB91300.1 bifunctional ligase/repressor BirA [Methylomusa anaerophila]HML90709.1 biotin--[acetyl-CoA-carboxylase] ligase [Methylomusa anaerophila]